MQQITALTGPAIAELFSDLIVGAGSPFNSPWTAVVVIGFSLAGGIGAFSVLARCHGLHMGSRITQKRPSSKQN